MRKMQAMNPSSWQTSAWYHALTLKERGASLNAARQGSQDLQAHPATPGRRWQRWQEQPPFRTGAFLTQRLAMDGVTEEEWRRLLSEPADAIRDRFAVAPAWLTDVT